jgi:hypothetical protein
MAMRIALSSLSTLIKRSSTLDGYAELQRQIVELSQKHSLNGEVKNMYSFLKIEANLANRRNVEV